MMTLNDIYKTNEIDGIPVTLLGIENLVATFEDVDGNEIEIQVDCRIESVPKNKRSRLHFPIAQLKGFKMVDYENFRLPDSFRWKNSLGEEIKPRTKFVECKECGFEVVPNEDGTCYNCSKPMELKK